MQRNVCLSSFCQACLLIIAVWITPTASAGILVGFDDVTQLPMNFEGIDSLEDKVLIGTESQPIPFATNESPTAPAWMKIITIHRQGQGWSPTGPNSMVNVMENLVNLPGTSQRDPITDWHESIDPTFGDGANFKWAPGATISIPGLGIFPGMTSADGKEVWFDFPPIPPGVPFMINKDLMWTGGVITGSDPNNTYTIKINERPSIPEPSAMLLAVGGLGLALWQWRRTRTG